MCVCVSVAAFLHYCTDPDVTWRNGRGCRLVVHYWADLQLVHWFRCYDNTAPKAKCQRMLCTRSMPGWHFDKLNLLSARWNCGQLSTDRWRDPEALVISGFRRLFHHCRSVCMKQFASGHLECIYFLHMLLNGSNWCLLSFLPPDAYGKIDVRFYKKRFYGFFVDGTTFALFLTFFIFTFSLI